MIDQQYDSAGYPFNSSIPGDRDRIQPPAAKPKTRTTTFAHHYHCPDCYSVLLYVAEFDPSTMRIVSDSYHVCTNKGCLTHGTRYKVPTVELEIIAESSSVPAQAAPVDPNAGAAVSLGEVFAKPPQEAKL